MSRMKVLQPNTWFYYYVTVHKKTGGGWIFVRKGLYFDFNLILLAFVSSFVWIPCLVLILILLVVVPKILYKKYKCNKLLPAADVPPSSASFGFNNTALNKSVINILGIAFICFPLICVLLTSTLLVLGIILRKYTNVFVFITYCSSVVFPLAYYFVQHPQRLTFDY